MAMQASLLDILSMECIFLKMQQENITALKRHITKINDFGEVSLLASSFA